MSTQFYGRLLRVKKENYCGDYCEIWIRDQSSNMGMINLSFDGRVQVKERRRYYVASMGLIGGGKFGNETDFNVNDPRRPSGRSVGKMLLLQRFSLIMLLYAPLISLAIFQAFATIRLLSNVRSSSRNNSADPWRYFAPDPDVERDVFSKSRTVELKSDHIRNAV